MPAKSKSQQRLFGIALSVKRGDTSRSDVDDEVLNIVDSMSEDDIEKYAGTKHDDLPLKAENVLREIIRKELNRIL